MRVLIAVLALGGGLLPATAAQAAVEPGTCWNLTSAQRTASRLPNATEVDCSRSHTAELMGVVTGEGLNLPDAFQACQGLSAIYVGKIPDGKLTAASYSLPRSVQLSVYLSKNAKKAYCVGFSTSPVGSVKARTGSVAGTGLTPRVCFNDTTWALQKCSAPKNVAMTNVVWLSKKPTQRYPGDAKVMRLAEIGCIELGNSARLLAEAWYVPGATEWNLGNRYAFCRLAPNETDTGWQVAS